MASEKVVRFVSSDAGGLVCECGQKLAHYELVTPTEKGAARKKILCCPRAACGNGAKMTAKIHRATLVMA